MKLIPQITKTASIAFAAWSAFIFQVNAQGDTAERKPVKVYILSGQSNMVGIGQVGPLGSTNFNTYVSADPEAEKGSTLSLYSGAYDPAKDYDKEKPVATHHVMAGYWPHTKFPTLEEPYTQIVRGFIRIPRKGEYSFISGNIVEINQKEVYRRESKKADAKETRITLEAGTYPIKITHYENGATNITHQIWDTPGTLTTAVKEQGKFPYLIDEKGDWADRADVWYKGLITAGADKWLNVGCGASSIQIGPELGFGHMLGNFHDEPVLLIKASEGNRSLGWDFLPPGSESFEYEGKIYAGYKDTPPSWEKDTTPKTVEWYAGKQYDDSFNAVHKVLDNFDTAFPHFAGRGYEIAGFVWWQGHKDGTSPYAERYEQNLVKLIDTLRKEFKAPKAPFVLGTIGFNGWEMQGPHKLVADAQLAVSGTSGKYPQYAGNVLTVETRDLWLPAEVSPRNQDFHYNQNAETYMNVGLALGKGMIELLSPEKPDK